MKAQYYTLIHEHLIMLSKKYRFVSSHLDTFWFQFGRPDMITFENRYIKGGLCKWVSK